MDSEGSISLRFLFLRHQAQTSPAPPMLEVERAEGVFLYDRAGKPYFDMISGISVSNVGHRHPEVVKAINDQVGRYMHVMVYGEFIQSPQVLLARELCSELPDHLNSVYFVNSGSEAVEGAMKLAKRYTGRSEVISFYNCYHGSTQGSLSMIGSEYFRQAFRPLIPGIRQINYNSFPDLEQITSATAAVFCETIQGEGGIIVPDNEWLKALRTRCSETGTLLVFDEIQCGFGRTGSMFAFQETGAEPDILLLAKGMGGGLPIGAFVSSREIMGTLSHDPVLGHITTFGGNAVCCAAARAVLKVVKSNNLARVAKEKEALIKRHFSGAPFNVRGRGLLLAADFGTAEIASRVMSRCMENGLITDWFLFADHCLRIAPPLTITEAELEEACGIFRRTAEEVIGS